MKKDYYKILNVPKQASIGQIKRAYRSLALTFHPDRVPPDLKEEAERLFKEITEAYQVLSDPNQRGRYDGESVHHKDFSFQDRSFSQDIYEGPNLRDISYNLFWSHFEIDSKSKLFALIVSGLYVIAAIVSSGISGIFAVGGLLLPLALIFFGEEMGSYVGWFRVNITSPTPGPFIIFMGWVILLIPFWMPILRYISSL